MPDYRCYVQIDPSTENAVVTLSPEESNHLVAANRARKGDLVRAFDGNGTEWEAVVEKADKRRADLRLGSPVRFEKSQPHITIAQALPKGKLLESIIRKAAEIGIQEICPISSERAESKVHSQKERTKSEKWHIASVEGAKQSGNPYLVAVPPLSEFEEFLRQSDRYDLKFIASLLPEAQPLHHYLRELNKDGNSIQSIAWLIGPEGDFSPEESEKAIAAGFLPVSLGPHVMRCETAAAHAMSITRFALGRD